MLELFLAAFKKQNSKKKKTVEIMVIRLLGSSPLTTDLRLFVASEFFLFLYMPLKTINPITKS